MKKCPFCAEDIQDDAVKCRYCGEFIRKRVPAAWYYKTHILILAFLSVGPFALPLLWFNPKINRRNKIVITTAVIIISCLLLIVIIRSIKSISNYYQQVFEL